MKHLLSRVDVAGESRFVCQECGWRRRYTDFALGRDWSRAMRDHDEERKERT